MWEVMFGLGMLGSGAFGALWSASLERGDEERAWLHARFMLVSFLVSFFAIVQGW
jgi:uncharacterized membrane protein